MKNLSRIKPAPCSVSAGTDSPVVTLQNDKQINIRDGCSVVCSFACRHLQDKSHCVSMLVFMLIMVIKMHDDNLVLVNHNPAVVFCSSPVSQKLMGVQFFPGYEGPTGPMGVPHSLALCPACQSFCCSVALRDSSIHQPLDHSGLQHHLHCHTRYNSVGISNCAEEILVILYVSVVHVLIKTCISLGDGVTNSAGTCTVDN